jgi:hypothetical protein
VFFRQGPRPPAYRRIVVGQVDPERLELSDTGREAFAYFRGKALD